MNFSDAISFLRKGKKIQRSGWNGKNQYIILARMTSCILADGSIVTDPLHVMIGSSFIMFVGTSGYQCGWLASQADMLADDWVVI